MDLNHTLPTLRLRIATNLISLFTICLFTVASFGQDILTNKAVIEMVKSGLSPEIVIAKIRSSSVSFDTSTEALKALSDEGVPEKVVVEMITEAGKTAKASAQTAKENEKLLNSVPEQGKLSELLSKSKVFLLTEDLKARDLIEKELRKVKKFSIVDKIEDSDFAIKYEAWVETVNVSATVVGNTATARENTQLVGLFTVLTASETAEGGRLRLVYSTRKSKYFVWEDNPAESTTKQFLKDLVKAAATAGANR
jgi:hypothetical protein